MSAFFGCNDLADRWPLGHAVTVRLDLRKASNVHAVAFQPPGDREQIGVADRIAIAHHPRPAHHYGLNQIERGGHGFGHLLFHGLERSGIVGASNPLAAPLHLALDGDRVIGWATYPQQYEGPPGCVHGGFVAAAFDDLLGAAQTLSGTAGFTGTLSVRMVRPTPLLERIDYEGGVKGVEGRKIFAWGRARASGEVVAEAEAVFIAPKGGTSAERAARAGATLPPTGAP